MPAEATPTTFEEAAGCLRDAGAQGRSVRLHGAGTKRGWGRPAPEADIRLSTTGLNRIAEHNVGDLTAVLDAGVPVAQAQARFAQAGQTLSLDPPLGEGEAATIGGLIATGDCGPLRHRYGAPRDLLLGMTVALSDGTVARSGGKVIKNVAGYDIAKLFAGAYGTLGLILSVGVRLHPLPPVTATTIATASDPATLAAAAGALALAPLELESLDVFWAEGEGQVLARAAGSQAQARCRAIAETLRGSPGLTVEVESDDAPLWARQRAAQRSSERVLARILARPGALTHVLAAAQIAGGRLVGRVTLGIAYVELDPAALTKLRQALPRGARIVLQDAPAELRSSEDPWGAGDPTAIELMRRVKQRFDPGHVCNPGVFVGGI